MQVKVIYMLITISVILVVALAVLGYKKFSAAKAKAEEP